MRHEYGGDGVCIWCTYDSFSSGNYHGECAYRPFPKAKCETCGDTGLVCASCGEPFRQGLAVHYGRGCRGAKACTCRSSVSESEREAP
jgi:hypothetical protein